MPRALRTPAAMLAARLVASRRVRRLRRAAARVGRALAGGRPEVDYFHQHRDPYSALALQAAEALERRYDVTVRRYAVSPPDEAAAPQPGLLAAYAERDALRLARRLGLSLAVDARALGAPDDTPEHRADGDARRARLGHYLGATFHAQGEWFWGVDRLAYLEELLAPWRRAEAPDEPIAPRPEPTRTGRASPREGLSVEAFISFRSPYTYLALARAGALAAAYGAALRLRYVLPMVMRGLPVPASKRLYIVRDCAREAERLGLPFGKIADPVGVPTERGLAVLRHAVSVGRGQAFAESFLRAVFAEGVDAGTDTGLAHIAARAGLDPAAAFAALADHAWRVEAEDNRAALFEAGLWGVPSFRVVCDGRAMPAHWGQDRLWAVEEDLCEALANEMPA